MHLTARREPTFHDVAQTKTSDEFRAAAGAHDAPHGTPHGAVRGSRMTRLVSTIQIVSTLLAVPLGLASGYSIYRANFAPETTCQQLRGNIVSMLDKNVDAATRRMLVRRDVEAFERSCGSVDPDAHAAFKLLLDAKPKVAAATVVPKAPMVAPPIAVVRKVDTKPEIKAETKSDMTAAIKLETKPESKLTKVEARPEPKPEPKAETETVQRDAALSDARWLEEVRQALVTHGPERADKVEQAKAATVKPLRAELPMAVRAATPVLPSSWTPPSAQAAPQPAYVAPSLPAQVNADRPVPPASIPMPAPVAETAPPNAEESSRLDRFIAEIPLVGGMIKRGEH